MSVHTDVTVQIQMSRKNLRDQSLSSVLVFWVGEYAGSTLFATILHTLGKLTYKLRGRGNLLSPFPSHLRGAGIKDVHLHLWLLRRFPESQLKSSGVLATELRSHIFIFRPLVENLFPWLSTFKKEAIPSLHGLMDSLSSLWNAPPTQ